MGVDGIQAQPTQYAHVTGTWWFSAYGISPSVLAKRSCSAGTRVLRLQLPPDTVSNAGIHGQPWFVLWPDRGSIDVFLQGAHKWVPFVSLEPRYGYITISTAGVARETIRLPALRHLAAGGVWAELNWPQGIALINRAGGLPLVVLGGCYAILSAALALVLVRRLWRL
jgi:hypothetical protein